MRVKFGCQYVHFDTYITLFSFEESVSHHVSRGLSSDRCGDVTGSSINLHVPQIGMGQYVPSQDVRLNERLAARLADIRLLPRMCPHVVHQAAGRRERLAAGLADMRLLPRMHAQVRSQGAD